MDASVRELSGCAPGQGLRSGLGFRVRVRARAKIRARVRAKVGVRVRVRIGCAPGISQEKMA